MALVCTEIPLLITQADSPLPILDSTRLLAAAAVEVALGERPMPDGAADRSPRPPSRRSSSIRTWRISRS